MRKRVREAGLTWLVFFVMAGLAGSGLAAQETAKVQDKGCGGDGWKLIDGYCVPTPEDTEAACAREHLRQSVEFDSYLFRSYRSDAGSCLKVLHEGRIIFQRAIDTPDMYSDGFTIGQAANKESMVPEIPNGADITGGGHPDMIVSLFTGGAHCCIFQYVFELEPKFRTVAVLNGEDSDPAYFADLDGNHRYYYLAEDWTFRYWPGDFASSPRTPVVLTFRDDNRSSGFHLALDKMQKPAPTEAEWRKSLQAVRHELKLEKANMVNFLPSVLWQEVLDLIYTGHSDLAWKFLDEAGPDAQKDPYPDLSDFCSLLKASPYWPDLQPTLKDTPEACANAGSKAEQ